MPRKLILIELNEINFDVVRRYLDSNADSLPAFRELMGRRAIVTTCEKVYEELEPWIQWPSVHTGKTYAEHGVLRLGDIVQCDAPQFFELLEEEGWRVGAVSPMNAANRMKRPAYFIPDPWTATPTDGSWWSKALSTAISQAVNDNAQARISPVSLLYLALGLVRFASPRHYLSYLRLALGAGRAPWRKALFLDLFLHDLHMRLLSKSNPDFSVLFLNAGAHIQHHYFFNARPLGGEAEKVNPGWYVGQNEDPIFEMLMVYDRILRDYISQSSFELVVATGLSQKPYDRTKFYYRLRDHSGFLGSIGVGHQAVHPRMTRDFLVEFEDAAAAAAAALRLSSITAGPDRLRLFGEIDNRGTSLFVTLTYPEDIRPDTTFELDGLMFPLLPHVAFVAIKNGMHQERGFAFFSRGIAPLAPEDGAHVKELFSTVLTYFSNSQRA